MLCMSGWVSNFQFRGRHFDSFAQVVDSRALREQADGARVSCAHAQGLFWCEHVDGSPRPHIAKKMQATLSKNVGIILYINVKYTAYIFVHRCKVYCLHFCAWM